MRILKNKLMLALLLVMSMPAVIFGTEDVVAVEGAIPPDTSIVLADIIFIVAAFIFAIGLMWFLGKRNNA